MQISRKRSRPTKYYDENIHSIDEQICELIAKRKTVSNNNPGFPPLEMIDVWATKFNLLDGYLHSIFRALYTEKIHRPRAEPIGFQYIVPVMKLTEVDTRVFLITHIRQYSNASVLYFQIDSKSERQPEVEGAPRTHIQWKLSINPDYECYYASGSGNHEQWVHRFVVSPALPDKLDGVGFKFTWRNATPDDETEDIGGEIILS